MNLSGYLGVCTSRSPLFYKKSLISMAITEVSEKLWGSACGSFSIYFCSDTPNTLDLFPFTFVQSHQQLFLRRYFRRHKSLNPGHNFLFYHVQRHARLDSHRQNMSTMEMFLQEVPTTITPQTSHGHDSNSWGMIICRSPLFYKKV